MQAMSTQSAKAFGSSPISSWRSSASAPTGVLGEMVGDVGCDIPTMCGKTVAIRIASAQPSKEKGRSKI